jgi:hypothetical protein
MVWYGMVWYGMWAAAPASVYYPNGPLSPRLVPVPVAVGHGCHATQSSGSAVPRNYFLWRPRAGSSMGGAWLEATGSSS